MYAQYMSFMGCSVRVGISTGIIYLLTPACMGTPAGAGGSTTCSVECGGIYI